MVCGSYLNRSYFIAWDSMYGGGNVTYFTYFSEFNRPWRGASYIEAGTMITLFILALIGNLFLVSVTIKAKASKSVTNNFVCNLALGDILFISSAPLVAYVRVSGTWHLGDGMCHLLNYGMFVCATAMIWTMAAISMDRYFCIYKATYPSRKLHPAHVALVCLCIWFVSACCFLPVAFFFHVQYVTTDNGVIKFCTLQWPEGSISYSLLFICTYFTLGFSLPLLVITINYFRIFKKFWTSKKAIGVIRREVTRHSKSVRSMRNRDIKIVKSLVLLVLVFIVFWLPLMIVFGLIYHDLQVEDFEIPSFGLAWCLIIAYIHPCLNPFLYGYMNLKLCKQFDCCCVFKRRSSEESAASNTQIQDNKNTTQM